MLLLHHQNDGAPLVINRTNIGATYRHSKFTTLVHGRSIFLKNFKLNFVGLLKIGLIEYKMAAGGPLFKRPQGGVVFTEDEDAATRATEPPVVTVRPKISAARGSN
jgi:hypothetical protein